MSYWDTLYSGLASAGQSLGQGIRANTASKERLFWHEQGLEREKQREKDDLARTLFMEQLAEKRGGRAQLKNELGGVRTILQGILNDPHLTDEVRNELTGVYKSTHQGGFDTTAPLNLDSYHKYLVSKETQEGENKKTTALNKETKERNLAEVQDVIDEMVKNPDRFKNLGSDLTFVRGLEADLSTNKINMINPEQRKRLADILGAGGEYKRTQDADKKSGKGKNKEPVMIPYQGGELDLESAKLLQKYYDAQYENLTKYGSPNDPDKQNKARNLLANIDMLTEGIRQASVKYPGAVSLQGSVNQPSVTPPSSTEPTLSEDDQQWINALAPETQTLINQWLEDGYSITTIRELYQKYAANTSGVGN